MRRLGYRDLGAFRALYDRYGNLVYSTVLRIVRDAQTAEEMVDAYALGALENQEAAALQQHLSDCAACREELSKSQRTAALLSLSVRIEQAPSSLRERILAMAETEKYELPAWRRFLLSRRT